MKGRSAEFSREFCEQLREPLLRDRRVAHKEVNASQILQNIERWPKRIVNGNAR
jgi:hypothetical protein